MEPKPNWNRTETELNRIESSVWNGNRVALLLTGKTEVKPNRTRTENEVAICPLYSTATNQRAATTVTTQEEETSREDEEHGKRRSNFGILQVSSGFFGFLATFMTISEQKKWRSSKRGPQEVNTVIALEMLQDSSRSSVDFCGLTKVSKRSQRGTQTRRKIKPATRKRV